MNSPLILLDSSPKSSNTSKSSLYPKVTVNKDFIARDDKQLSVFQGDTLELLDDTTDPNWNLVRETFSGKIGYIPVEVCESLAEQQARINARINSIIESKKAPKEIPKKSRHGKSVSFVSKSPEIIPIYFSGSLSASSMSPLNEENKVLEEKFEAELNLRKILEDQQAQPNTAKTREEPKLLRIYCGNVNGPSNIIYRTITATQATTWMQIERKAMQKFDTSAARLDLVHSETLQRIQLPADFTLAQAILVSRHATQISINNKKESTGRGHYKHSHSKIQELIGMVRGKTSPPLASNAPSSYRLVLNSNIKRTNVFKIIIKVRKASVEEECVFTVDYNDKVSDIAKMLYPNMPRVHIFGRLGGSELLLTASGTISDAMRLFDCGPEGCMDPSCFKLVINIP